MQRKELMKAIAREISQKNADAVLKGGTALLIAYELDRFSEDMDFDIPRGSLSDFEESIKRAAMSVGLRDVSVIVKKDTDTTKRFMLHYGAFRDNDRNGDYPLKIEISMRNAEIDRNDVNEKDGIRVYTIERLAEQKINAFLEREAGRDIYDVAFLTSRYPDVLTENTWKRIEKHVNERGIDALSAAFEEERREDALLIEYDADEIVLTLQENIQNHLKQEAGLQQRHPAEERRI
jgi:predicted nucleotidyltransferase component of viral defense system